jgi:hypothetical protein
MSLKLAALSSLTSLSALGAQIRGGHQAENLEPVGPHEESLTTFVRRSSATEPDKPETGGESDKARSPRCDLKLAPAKDLWR